MSFSLDVGCGSEPRGVVNCDLFLDDGGVHRGKGREKLNVKRSWNFVLCSCEKLPFPDGCFDEVSCFHVVEHMKNPLLLLCELLRVAKERVVVRCPHWLGEKSIWFGRFNPSHLWHFNIRWFKRFGEWYGVRTSVGVSAFCYPLRVMYFELFKLPCEVEVVFDKRWM